LLFPFFYFPVRFFCSPFGLVLVACFVMCDFRCICCFPFSLFFFVFVPCPIFISFWITFLVIFITVPLFPFLFTLLLFLYPFFHFMLMLFGVFCPCLVCSVFCCSSFLLLTSASSLLLFPFYRFLIIPFFLFPFLYLRSYIAFSSPSFPVLFLFFFRFTSVFS